MYSRTQIRQGVLHPPCTQTIALAALAFLSLLAISACEREEDGAATTPLAPVHESVSSSGGGDASESALATTLGGPIAGLTDEELARFDSGLDEFSELETLDEGLGPVFNEAGCFVCHDGPIGGTNGRLETRFGYWYNRVFDPLARYGGSLMQDHGIGKVTINERSFNFVAEVVPRKANKTALRLTTPLFGLGLVDAVSDAAFKALALRQPWSVRGKVHMVTEIRTGGMRVGRFGWKAQVPTLFQFAGDAYLNEMGITSPEFPNESAPQGNSDALKFNPMPGLNDEGEGVDLFADFMKLLGPPPRGAITSVTSSGEKVFYNIGCATCHTPTLQTGFNEVAALSNKTFHPYSDFLLHDMGNLGDGIVQGAAGGRDMRTAPLWGLTSRPLFLHDGRAKTPEAAILAHDGQGRNSRENYRRLDYWQRQALNKFLASL